MIVELRKWSFFEGPAYNIGIYAFLNEYTGHTSLQCAKATGRDYKHTAVDWGSFIWEMFCQYTYGMYNIMTQFEGEIELDESLLGRKVNYNKGDPKGYIESGFLE